MPGESAKVLHIIIAVVGTGFVTIAAKAMYEKFTDKGDKGRRILPECADRSEKCTNNFTELFGESQDISDRLSRLEATAEYYKTLAADRLRMTQDVINSVAALTERVTALQTMQQPTEKNLKENWDAIKTFHTDIVNLNSLHRETATAITNLSNNLECVSERINNLIAGRK